MTSITRFASLAVVSALFVAPSEAAAAVSLIYKVAGDSLYSQDISNNSCTSSELLFSAFDSITHEQGKPVAGEEVFISGSGFDCTTHSGYYFFSIDAAAVELFEVAGNGASASLVATIPVYLCLTVVDEPDACSETSATIEWTAQAIGSPVKESAHHHINYGHGGHYISRSKRTTREAQASGTVTVDGLVLPFGEGDFHEAFINRESFGTVEIIQGV